MSLARESKQRGTRPAVPPPARERGGFTPAAPRPSSRRGRSARAHTGASGQITAAGDTCRNHQSPLAPCSPIRLLITCRVRSPWWARTPSGQPGPPGLRPTCGGISITPGGGDSDKVLWRRGRIPGFSDLSRGSGEEPPVFRLRQPEDGRGLGVEGQASGWKLEVKPASVVATRKSPSRVSSPTR